jgi:hypothetical protein
MMFKEEKCWRYFFEFKGDEVKICPTQGMGVCVVPV